MQKIKSHPNIIHAENNTFTLEIMTKDLSTKIGNIMAPEAIVFLFWVFPYHMAILVIW